MRRKWFIVGTLGFLQLLILVAIVALLWGWAGRVGGVTNARSNHRSRSDFVDKTDVMVHTLDVRPAMEVIDLSVEADLQGGSMSWRVTDPTGEVRWEKEIDPTEGLNESRRFKPVSGVWKLEIVLEGASGHYDVHWLGSN